MTEAKGIAKSSDCYGANVLRVSMFQYASSQGVYTLSMYVCSPSTYVCLPSWYVCMYAKLVCMFAKLVCMSGRKIVLWRRGQIPYENLSVFNVQFNFSRFVRGGTVDDPGIPNLSAREAHHTHTYIHTSSAIGNPPQGEGF